MTAITATPHLSRSTPERLLWIHVIGQALDDLADADPIARDEAVAFFASGGSWTRARAEIAAQLDTHPDVIRRCGLRRMAELHIVLKPAVPKPAPKPPRHSVDGTSTCPHDRPPPHPGGACGRSRKWTFNPFAPLPSESHRLR